MFIALSHSRSHFFFGGLGVILDDKLNFKEHADEFRILSFYLRPFVGLILEFSKEQSGDPIDMKRPLVNFPIIGDEFNCELLSSSCI